MLDHGYRRTVVDAPHQLQYPRRGQDHQQPEALHQQAANQQVQRLPV
jgi:hypothetical protein